MANNKPGGEKISKAEAAKMKKAYKDKNKGKTEMVGFSADFIRELVSNPAVDTVWLAFAENDNGENTIIIQTMDAASTTIDDGDRGQLCPPNCP